MGSIEDFGTEFSEKVLGGNNATVIDLMNAGHRSEEVGRYIAHAMIGSQGEGREARDELLSLLAEQQEAVRQAEALGEQIQARTERYLSSIGIQATVLMPLRPM